MDMELFKEIAKQASASGKPLIHECLAEISRLRAPQEQAGSGEAVAWVYPQFFHDLEKANCGTAYRLQDPCRIPLYTHPQPAQQAERIKAYQQAWDSEDLEKRLSEQLAAAQKDAERYRWVRQRPYWPEENSINEPEWLDQAIDAAIAAHQQNGADHAS